MEKLIKQAVDEAEKGARSALLSDEQIARAFHLASSQWNTRPEGCIAIIVRVWSRNVANKGRGMLATYLDLTVKKDSVTWRAYRDYAKCKAYGIGSTAQVRAVYEEDAPKLPGWTRSGKELIKHEIPN